MDFFEKHEISRPSRPYTERDFNSRIPRYNDDSDYTTNAPSYYDDLARKNQLLKTLSYRIWEYQEVINKQFNEWDEELQKRFLEWDKNLEEFDEEVMKLLRQWIDDGTFAEIINEEILSWKADKSYVDDEFSRIDTALDTKLDKDLRAVNLKDFGAKGNGVTDDSEALTTALKYLSLNGGGKLIIPEGVYHTNGAFDVDSNIMIQGDGKKTVFKRDDHSMMFTINGSLTHENAVTQNSELGDNFITVSNPADFKLNEYIKIVSQRNALSKDDNTDDYYLGQATNTASDNPHKLYFGEIRQISFVNEETGQLFFRGGLIFPDYLTHNNNETDQTGKRNATVYKINFKEDVVFKDLTFEGDFSNIMRFDTVKSAVVDNCNWVNAYDQSFVTFHNSYMSEARNSRVDYIANYTPPVDNSRNPFKSVSSVNCGFNNIEVYHGSQCVDFTYSTDNGGIPNQNSYLVNSRMVNPIYDGISIHPGTLNAVVSNNEFIHCHADGIFNRSKKALIVNNVVTGSMGNSDLGSSYGVKVSHDSMQGTVVKGNNIEGFKIGVGTRDNVNTEIKKVNLLITDNTFSRINVGVQLRRNSGSTFTGDSNVRITNNIFTNFVAQYAKLIDIYDHYFNIFIENNIFEFSPVVNGGIYTRGNVSKIYVNNNFFTKYSTTQSILFFGDITDDNITDKSFQFEGNKFDSLRVSFSNMNTGNLNNGFSNSYYTNLNPGETNKVSLGTPSYRWRYLYSMSAPDVVSDERLKENIEREVYGLDTIKQLNPVSYTMKENSDGVKHGLIAQEVEKIITDGSIVRQPDDESEYYSMQYEQLIPIIIKAIQELNDKLK